MTTHRVRNTRPVIPDVNSAEMKHAQSVTTTSAAKSSNPSLPHDRDEKVDMTGGVPSARVQQGARDLKRGLSDTTRAPEADVAYRKLKK